MPIPDKLKKLVLEAAKQKKVCEKCRHVVFLAGESLRASQDILKERVATLLNEARVVLRGESPKDAKPRPTVAADSLCRLLVIDGGGYLLNVEQGVSPGDVLHEYEIHVEREK